MAPLLCPASPGLDVFLLAFALCLAALAGLIVGWVWRPSSAFASASATATASVRPAEAEAVVGEDDLRRLCRLLAERDGGAAWRKTMERSVPGMRYEAWQRGSPLQYRSRTVYESEAEAETVRDFFWDVEFRTASGWDDMMLHHEILEEYPGTGAMVVRWLRKLPLFCSDREYIVARRIWRSGTAFYCVTKGVPRPCIPRQKKLRRVESYYSSWCIRPVEGEHGSRGTEVVLFHQEDMGVPDEIAKLCVRQAMWGFVSKIHPALRAYLKARAAGHPLSRYASMAHITTHFDADRYCYDDGGAPSFAAQAQEEAGSQGHWARGIPKLAVIGATVALACTVHRGLVGRAVILGVAVQVARLAGRL